MKVQTLAIAASLALVGSGCNVARFTHVPSTPNAATSARHNVSEGEPGLVASGWGLPPADGHGFATYVHDPAVANGCNEWDSEPVAELDNDGQLCKSVLP